MTEDKQGIFPTVCKLFTNAPEEVAGAAVGQHMATTQILLCGVPRALLALKGQRKPPSQVVCTTSRRTLFVSCPWLTLQVLAKAQRKGPRPAGLLSPNFQAQPPCQLPGRHHWRPGHSPAGYKDQPREPHRHAYVPPRRLQLWGSSEGAPASRPGVSHKPQEHAGGSRGGETGDTRHTMTI